MRLRRPPIAQRELWRKQGDINARMIRQLSDDRETIGELAGNALRLLEEITELRDELNDVANHLPGYVNMRRRRVLLAVPLEDGAEPAEAERDAGPPSPSSPSARPSSSPSSPSPRPSSSAFEALRRLKRGGPDAGP